METSNPYAAPQANLSAPAGSEIDTTSPFSPKGRFGRVTYLAYVLSISVVFGVIMALGGAMDGGRGMMVTMVVGYAIIVPLSIIFMIRRLHDIDWSGWWAAGVFVPLLNLFVVVPLLFFRGTPGSNRYGAPRPTTRLHKIVAAIAALLYVTGFSAAIAIPAYQAYVMRAQQKEPAQPLERVQPLQKDL